MGDSLVRLRPDVAVEPLVGSFVAWLHNIPPVNLTMQVHGHQLPMLESYLAAPELHAEACTDPGLRGGPFVDIEPTRTGDVERLRAELAGDAALAELADAWRACRRLVEGAEPKDRLSDLVKRVPGGLRGYVEPVFDIGHRPDVRLFEAMLYRSRFHDRGRQALGFSAAAGIRRPFMLSTPRLTGQDRLVARCRFKERSLDALFASVRHPLPLDAILDELDVEGDRSDLGRYFTASGATAPERIHTGPGLRVRYFGHATLLLEGGGSSVLIDPVVTPGVGSERFDESWLPDRVELCLITHGHPDHFNPETLLRLRWRLGTIVVPRCSGGSIQDPSLALACRELGFDDVREVDALDELAVDGGRVTVAPFLGEHGDLDIRAKATYLVSLGGVTVYVAADSAGHESRLYRNLAEVHGGTVDAAFIGMECEGAPLTWLYGPLYCDGVERSVAQSRRLAGSNAEQAHSIVRELDARSAYVYAMGLEPWLQHVVATNYSADSLQLAEVRRLVSMCQEAGIPAELLDGPVDLIFLGSGQPARRSTPTAPTPA